MDDAEPTVHRCVGLLLCDEDRVLLARRSSNKSWYPDCWDVVGGHIEPGETEVAALRRETIEELAVDLLPEAIAVVGTMRTEDVDLTVFTATGWSGTPVNAAPEEHDEIAWKTISEIADLDLADPAIYDLAVQALETTGTSGGAALDSSHDQHPG